MRRFRSDEFVPYLMRRVSERLSKSLAEALKPFDQTPNAWRVLVALVSRDRASISELAEFTIIDQSTLSRTVDRMEEQRLVKRAPSEADGRTVVVSVTEAGQRAFEQMLPIASAQYEWAIRGIPARNVDVMRTTLQQMLNNIRFSPIK
jgi:DNA-binding MarR family transcriptional regulator